MAEPTLAVVMPNYNHAKYLPRGIEGILNQTRPPDEFLILDDASTDNSVEIIESYAKDSPTIRLVRHSQNQGVVAAHQTLFDLATADYVYPAAADDDRYPNFFASTLSMAEQYPQAGIIFGKLVVQNERGEEIDEIGVTRWQEPLFASPEVYRRDYLEGELASHSVSPSMIFRREAFAEVGWYRPELGSWTDTFAARAMALKYGACYVPERFAIWHKMAEGFSAATRKDPRQMLDIIATAEQLMTSPEFADRFPADYVQRWSREYRKLAIWNYWLGDDSQSATNRPPFLVRNFQRLPRTLEAIRLAFYRGQPNRQRRGGADAASN